MPWPKEVVRSAEKFIISPDFTIQINHSKESKVTHAATKFLRRLSNRTGVFLKNGFPSINNKKASLQITFNTIATPVLGVDESYSLEVKNNQILLNSKNDIGAVRGLETLLQLVKNTKSENFWTTFSK